MGTEQENLGTTTPATPPSAGVTAVVPPVEPEVTPKPEDVDENGVPWKNRAMEAQRKLNELQERVAQPPEPPVEEDPYEKQQREVAEAAVEKRLRYERFADGRLREHLNALEGEYSLIKKYRGKIESELGMLPAEVRANPLSVRKIAFSVIGEYSNKEIEDITRTAKVNSEKPGKLVELNATLPPSGTPAARVELTNEEIAFGDEKNLFSRFSDAEIREMYKERKEKQSKTKK